MTLNEHELLDGHLCGRLVSEHLFATFTVVDWRNAGGELGMSNHLWTSRLYRIYVTNFLTKVILPVRNICPGLVSL
ncbi:MAG: hypothetical protein ACK517_03150 [bacterium]|jgi:hypothetical protein